ncbi:MAG TPA: STAS domain-containing protein [bacterium]|nr:STAS domain-containing protein [bacterium]
MDNSMEFKLEERSQGDVVVLDVRGNLDVQSAPTLKVRLDSLVNFGHQKIVLNLSDVGFIDSTGVGSLIYAQKIINPIKGGLRIIGITPRNLNVFSVMNLTDVFSIMKTEEAAVGSFHRDDSTVH